MESELHRIVGIVYTEEAIQY